MKRIPLLFLVMAVLGMWSSTAVATEVQPGVE